MINMLQDCAYCDGEGETPSEAFTRWHGPIRDQEFQEAFGKSFAPKLCIRCQGQGDILYIGGEKERFNILADRWEKETGHYSIIQTEHPCFVEMDKMKSKEAIGWLLERMTKKPTHLMMLLGMWVKKKDNPITDDMAGKVTKITEAWIKWGIEKKFIEK